MSQLKRASGCMFGLALGDALAAPTEFLRVEEILHRFPPDGPRQPEGDPALVTDDTQMAIAVGEAIIEAATIGWLDNVNLEDALRRAFVEWMKSPDNNRAPGITCLRACENLAEGMSWHTATVASSKGCGANMRVAPVAFLKVGKYGVTEEMPAAIAQFQAAMTHGHPTALAASDLTSAAITYLAQGGEVINILEYLRDYAESQRFVYAGRWLGPLWQQPGVAEPKDFISRGWDDCLSSLELLEAAVERGDRATDPCLMTGAGWVAEEAVATGLLCFLLFKDDPVAALRRASVTSGDSDSIACLTGAFAGACYGLDAWPESWIERIEYRNRLAMIGSFFDEKPSSRPQEL